VGEPRRGKGTGSRLLAAALRKLKELGVRAVYLRAVPINQDWLVPLLRFYWRFGFDVVPDCTDANDKALTLRATLL
jgi:GNAT superfamily N-acetyltransferase